MFKNKLFLYIKLMRLDKPIGIFLLLCPSFWVIAYSNEGNLNNQLSLIFLIGVITTRTIGCVINDFFDKDFDKHVIRTKNRPYASKLISTKEVLIIFTILAMLNLSLFFFLNLKAIYFSLIAIIFIIFYPFTKRFFKAPQIFLGFTFATSTFISYAAVTNSFPNFIIILFFFGTLVWVTMFDTIYAMSDKKDDLKIGVNSTAILFGDKDKIAVALLQFIFFVIFLYIGYLNEYSYIYYLFLVFAIMVGVYNQLLIKKRDLALCMTAFKNNQYIGYLIFFGIYGEYI